MYGTHSSPVRMTVSVSQNNSRVIGFPLTFEFESRPGGTAPYSLSAPLRATREPGRSFFDINVRGCSPPFDFHNDIRYFLHFMYARVRYNSPQFEAILWANSWEGSH